MKLHVYEGDYGVSVSCSDVPADLTDADVRYTVEECATAGDKVAARALALVARHGAWITLNKHSGGYGYPSIRVYVDA